MVVVSKTVCENQISEDSNESKKSVDETVETKNMDEESAKNLLLFLCAKTNKLFGGVTWD